MNEHDVISRLSVVPDEDVTVHVDVDAVITTVKLQRKRRRGIAATMLATVALIAGLIVVTSRLDRDRPPTEPAGRGPWVVNSPAVKDTFLESIAAISRTDVWTVGFQHLKPDTAALAMHWDGTRWQRFDFPKGRVLSDVAAVAANDVWAVGRIDIPEGNNTYGMKSLAMHWDGQSWREASVPGRGKNSELTAVAAVSTDNVWAVGDIVQDSQNGQPYIVHWDGQSWQLVTTPVIPDATHLLLRSISARAANDIWVAGMNTPGAGQHPLALHWDGRTWSAIAVPDEAGDLVEILALAPNEVWAAGQRAIFRWDGSRWQQVAVPGPMDGQFMTLAPDGAGGILVAGREHLSCAAPCTTKPDRQPHVHVARWTGTEWVPVPPPVDAAGSVQGLSTTRAGDVWAVGFLKEETQLHGGPEPLVGDDNVPVVASTSFR